MNFIVPTSMRVGSTLATLAISNLVGDENPKMFNPEIPFRLSKSERDMVVEGNNRVFKTHRLTPANFTTDCANGKLGVISVRRRFMDVLPSQVMYYGKRRLAEGQDRPKIFRRFNEQYNDLPDKVYLNLFIDTHFGFVQEQIAAWLKFERSFCSSNAIQFNYDQIWQKGNEWMIMKLVEVFDLDITKATLDKTIKACEFKARGSKGHQRQGKPNNGLVMIDKSLRDKINLAIRKQRTLNRK